MVAAFLELDSGGAVETALPAFALSRLGEPQRGFVFGAVAARVPFAVAGVADLGAAAAAFPILTTCVGAAGGVHVDLRRFDPLAAATGRAVYAVFGGEFMVFLVPFHLEAEVEQLLHVFQGNVVLGAAPRRHVLGIGDGHGEDPSEAGVAHTVFASQLGGFGDGNVRG